MLTVPNAVFVLESTEVVVLWVTVASDGFVESVFDVVFVATVDELSLPGVEVI